MTANSQENLEKEVDFQEVQSELTKRISKTKRAQNRITSHPYNIAILEVIIFVIIGLSATGVPIYYAVEQKKMPMFAMLYAVTIALVFAILASEKRRAAVGQRAEWWRQRYTKKHQKSLTQQKKLWDELPDEASKQIVRQRLLGED